MAHRFRNMPTRNTTEAGYGNAHQREARRRRQTTQPTDTCGYCHQQLGPERLPGDKASRWHLPHTRDRSGYMPGMWHATCNRREGAIAGNRAQRARKATTKPVRRRNWLTG